MSEAQGFVADLDLLASELPRRHANLFHDTRRETFETAVAALRERLPGLDRGTALVELARLVALAKDGHTALFLLPFPGAAPVPGIHQLPIALYAFPDGLRVTAIERTHQSWLGAHVEAIGGAPVEEALTRMAALLPADNPMGLRDYGPFYLGLPEVLAATGLAASAESAVFTLTGSAGRRDLELRPLAVPPDAGWASRLVSLPGAPGSWVSAADLAPRPAWLHHESEPWWFERLADGTVYAQVNLLRDGAQTFAAWSAELLAAVPRDDSARLVIDLRLNRGGNGDLIWPLVHGLIRHDLVNRPGRLFVLTGRRTFSAAQLFANALEQHTAAVFVGEPTGSAPNHWGELGQLALPRTGLAVLYAALRFQAQPRDQRPWIPPHVAVELGYDDLVAGRDPVLAAVAAYVAPPSVREVLAPGLAPGGDIAAAVAALRTVAARHRNPWRHLFERDLNTIGYELLGARRADDAVRVLALAAEIYPESANAWDSLGEAHAAAGHRARAVYCYARSLRHDPTNISGEQMLDRLLGDTP